MAPGIDGLPAAERDVDVSGPVARFLGSVSPRVLRRLKLGLLAFEWLPFPWRFSRLDQAAREDFLLHLEKSSLSLHHDLLLMAKLFSTLGYAVTPQVQERIGIEIGCALADGALPEPAGPLGDLEPAGDGEECDVVIVGSGAGGAVAAACLAEEGLDVLVLEAGGHYNRENYPTDHLEAITALYRDAGLTIAAGRPPIPVPVAKVVGGTTVINSGTCFRTPAPVLELWRERFGLDELTEPALEPFFRRVERTLNVAQVPAKLAGRNAAVVRRGAEALGWSGDFLYRNVRGCVGSGVCAFGCPAGAKQHVGITYVSQADAAADVVAEIQAAPVA